MRQHAILPNQRHDVRNRSQRRQRRCFHQECAEFIAHARRITVHALADFPCELERDAGAAEVWVWILVIKTGMNHREAIRQNARGWGMEDGGWRIEDRGLRIDSILY